MAVYQASGVNETMVVGNVLTTLNNLRKALQACVELQKWAAGLAASDLIALGMSSADASTTLSAIADANALAQIYNTGLPPGTYPQPSSAYVYGSSQRQVIGPQTL